MNSIRHRWLVLICLLAYSTGSRGAAPADGLAQAEAFLEKRFKQLDLDGDGKLSVEEAKPVEAWLRGADANHDGFLTLEEIRNHLRARLGELVEARLGGGAAPAQSPSFEAPPAPLYSPADSPREEPRQLKAGECGIGLLVPEVNLTDSEGRVQSLGTLTGGRPAVLALVSSSCPVSKRYLPSLGRLAREYAAQGVTFLLMTPNASDSNAELQPLLKAAGLTAPFFRDAGSTLLQTLGATASTDVFLVDSARTLVYRGAIDDQYGLSYSRDQPRHNYLRDALQSVLAGSAPEIAATEAPGCLLDLSAGGKPASSALALTYHNRISRLLQANCLECHRSGGVAPFSLETYEQVTAKSGMIRKMVERGLMPPWFAAAPAAGAHSPWRNDRSLAERDRADLLAWLSAGKPLGEAKDAPVARLFPSEWQIGKPDAVVQIGQPIEVKAEGVMPYQAVTVETSFGEDKWVRGLEIHPTAPEVVHHVLVFAQAGGGGAEGGRARFAGEQDERSGFFAAYVPGNSYVSYPEGFAKLLPAGAKLRFQIHYTPNGKATRDQVKLGLVFASEPPQHIVHVAGVTDHRLNIPPGAERHPQTALLPVPKDVKLLGFTPHMHLRGAAFRYEAILPDGTVKTLLDVPRYDFNWQLTYRYADPAMLPAGSKIRATGWFDNSTNNPANPDPSKTVHWGPQTSDEMMLGFVEYYIPAENPPSKTAAR